MNAVDVGKLNRALHGCVELVRFDLSRDAEGQRFDLHLTLADGKGRSVSVVCRDVQNLELNPAGNGFEKMCLLEVSDMSGDGLDRIRFCVEEVKRETLFLHCADLELRESQS
jgi:hypothetical protein